jgi:hypothetical protein
MSDRRQPKFRVGQFVRTKGVPAVAFKIKATHYFDDTREWVYMRFKDAVVGFPEQTLRLLTAKEARHER